MPAGITALALGIAAWMRWQSGVTESGEIVVVDDPLAGETAALLYTAGFAHTLYNSLRATLEGSGATLSVALYVYAKEQGEFDVAFAIAAILMALALLINLAAMLTGRYFKKRRSL